MKFTAEELARHPDFLLSIRHLAGTLRGMFQAGPRLARLLTSHQRWLLTQTAYALAMHYDPGDPSSGFSAVSLTTLITKHKVASRNTVLNFIEELLTYRFITHAPGEERRRPRHFEPAEVSNQAMYGWLLANLVALDMLDDGDRAACLQAHPQLLRIAQPLVARACLEDAAWREPPEPIALFLWTEAGGLVVDQLMARIDLDGADTERFDVGRVETRNLAGDFMMSRTHLQRLFAKAVQQGCLGWYDEPRKTRLWVSRNFVWQYCGWQAIKFAYVEHAFHIARAKLEGVPVKVLAQA
ncbi:hypothetical protein AM571_CH01208 [Rhizobium etli 8C-3]|uniref:Uncharacterized protein n=1 Tax=Rhizobium etli 8C-3 TaxID=538025 RepID=A0A1L5P1N4_RHIET|nr:hypothetical protein [Rhizobium etli]APO74045.1 hypothetical protein AM571_CH01208 [Rhizobium etli 8C-3]